jgi:hypothetical protein
VNAASESEPPAAATPDPAPAIELVATLRGHGIDAALGGSGLLESLGLETHVRDWDLTTDVSEDEVRRAVSGRTFGHSGNNGVHADSKLVFEDGPIDLIVRFAFFGDAGIVRIPTVVTGEWRGIPVGSPSGWAVAYAMMGRAEKSERLFAHLERTRADRAGVERLLAQPLPPALAARVRALPL